MKKNLFKGITFILLICSAQIQAQEYLGVKIGGFFEQLYGGETDEEAIDICGTQDDYLFGGWTDVTVEEATSKDATYWYTNRFGKQNYVKYLGSHETDEVTTGIVSVTPEYFAICVHESGNWEQDEVKTGDRLWVYYIDVATGTVQWSDFLSYEEGGAAPTDIQYDGSGNLYVLLNRLTSTGAIQTEVLNYDLLGNKLWTSQPYLNSTLGHWSSELVVNSTGLTTFPYDLSAKNPGAITYNFSGVIINGTSFTADGESRIYGIYEDTVNGDIYGAGYVIGENSDTNAYVLKTNSSLVQQSSENYGVNGTEKFRDIVITGDGFIAAGVRNNKGEGGYDCYIEHLDIQLLSFYNETFGGKTNERLGSLMINDLGTHAWFAGYNIEYKIANSGNAYIGGVSTQLNSSMVSCESPRVLLVDKLVSNNNINSYLNLGLVSSIISTCTTHNIKNVLLYDIDRIYAPGSGVTTQTKADVDTFLQKLIDAGIRIGFIVGPDMGKIKALTDIMKGVTVHSINFYSKINYIMLEHEFWNPTSLDAPTVLDRNAYNASWSTGAKYLNIPSGQRNKYFWHLTKDHQKLLEEIENELGNNHNWWASLDYISYLKNLDASISPVYYNFTDTDINALTLVPGATPLNILENQREGLAEEFIKKSDYTFLVYYRNAASTNHFIGTNNISGDPNFAFNNASSDYYKRLEAYRNKAAFAKDPTIGFNHIALFSNESISNGCAAFNWLGNWLGGANTYRKVELAYKGQINACATCSTNTVLGGFGWFKYSCIASHNSFTGAQKYDLVSCTQGGQIGLANESIVNGYDIYPNPSNARIKISFNNPNGISKMSIDYVIYKPSGQMVLEGSIGNKDEIDIGRLENGLYLVTLMKDKENVTKKFIKY